MVSKPVCFHLFEYFTDIPSFFNEYAGFAFVIQAENQSAIGEGGCQLGYGGIRSSYVLAILSSVPKWSNVPSRLALEFDTYQSADRCDDPSSNHVR